MFGVTVAVGVRVLVGVRVGVLVGVGVKKRILKLSDLVHWP